MKHDPQDGQRPQLDAPPGREDGGKKQGQQIGLGMSENLAIREVEFAVAVDRYIAFEGEEEEGRVVGRERFPTDEYFLRGRLVVVFLFFVG